MHLFNVSRTHLGCCAFDARVFFIFIVMRLIKLHISMYAHYLINYARRCEKNTCHTSWKIHYHWFAKDLAAERIRSLLKIGVKRISWHQHALHWGAARFLSFQTNDPFLDEHLDFLSHLQSEFSPNPKDSNSFSHNFCVYVGDQCCFSLLNVRIRLNSASEKRNEITTQSGSKMNA